jgi:hypothetical protein
MFLRDTVDHNSLTDSIEFTKEDIDNAIFLAIAKWNAIPPISNVQDPSYMNAYVLLCGVCGILLKSEGLRQNRNQLTVQDGNITPVGLDDKQDAYMRWAMHFQQEFQQFAQRIKIQENMESIMDRFSGFSSGYAYAGRYTY